MFCNENYLHIRWRRFSIQKSVWRNARTAKCWYTLAYCLAYAWWKSDGTEPTIYNILRRFRRNASFRSSRIGRPTIYVSHPLIGIKQTFWWSMSSDFLESTSERLWSTLTVCQRVILVLRHCGVASKDMQFAFFFFSLSWAFTPMHKNWLLLNCSIHFSIRLFFSLGDLQLVAEMIG